MMDSFSPNFKWIVPGNSYGHARQKFLTWAKSLSHVGKDGRKGVLFNQKGLKCFLFFHKNICCGAH